jgi:hypothetical protein
MDMASAKRETDRTSVENYARVSDEVLKSKEVRVEIEKKYTHATMKRTADLKREHSMDLAAAEIVRNQAMIEHYKQQSDETRDAKALRDKQGKELMHLTDKRKAEMKRENSMDVAAASRLREKSMIDRGGSNSGDAVGILYAAKARRD